MKLLTFPWLATCLWFELLLEKRCAHALVAQWIEHGSPKAGVGGSIPLWGTFYFSLLGSTRPAGEVLVLRC